jgi:hypothetical protein
MDDLKLGLHPHSQTTGIVILVDLSPKVQLLKMAHQVPI